MRYSPIFNLKPACYQLRHPCLFQPFSLAIDSNLQVYQNGGSYNCLMINNAGNVQACSISNVLCEKSLVKDARICLNKNSLATSIVTNQTTLINLPNYATASSCIEYCRGTIGNQVWLVFGCTRLFSICYSKKWQFWTKHWTTVAMCGNLVPTNVKSQMGLQTVPFCVHACQILDIR